MPTSQLLYDNSYSWINGLHFHFGKLIEWQMNADLMKGSSLSVTSILLSIFHKLHFGYDFSVFHVMSNWNVNLVPYSPRSPSCTEKPFLTIANFLTATGIPCVCKISKIETANLSANPRIHFAARVCTYCFNLRHKNVGGVCIFPSKLRGNKSQNTEPWALHFDIWWLSLSERTRWKIPFGISIWRPLHARNLTQMSTGLVSKFTPASNEMTRKEISIWEVCPWLPISPKLLRAFGLRHGW